MNVVIFFCLHRVSVIVSLRFATTDGHRHSEKCAPCEIADIHWVFRRVVHYVEDLQVAVSHLNI